MKHRKPLISSYSLRVFLIVVGVVMLIGFLNIWVEGMDAERRTAAYNYEECVKREYGMMPVKWYEEQGKYPVCVVE